MFGSEHTMDFSPTDEQQGYILNNGQYFFAIQTCEDGYDYTIYYDDLSEYDGGQLDMPELSMSQAIQDILDDFGLSKLSRERCDYGQLDEAVYAAQFSKASPHPALHDRLANTDRAGEKRNSHQRPLETEFEH